MTNVENYIYISAIYRRRIYYLKKLKNIFTFQFTLYRNISEQRNLRWKLAYCIPEDNKSIFIAILHHAQFSTAFHNNTAVKHTPEHPEHDNKSVNL